jgi:uncharacterized protein
VRGASAPPQRSCVACRRVRPRPELIRFVRLAEGRPSIDLGGRAAGRGAYLCRDEACWTLARKRRALDRALRVTVDADDWSSWRSGIL